MEWEPIVADVHTVKTGFDDHNGGPFPLTSSATTNCNSKEEANVDDLNRFDGVTGQFEDHDVLLNGCARLGNMLKGATFYREQLNLLRPLFQRADVEKQRIVQHLLESVWARDGRFLLVEPKSGVISVATNATAARLVRRDLQRKSPNNKKRQNKVKRDHNTKIKKNNNVSAGKPTTSTGGGYAKTNNKKKSESAGGKKQATTANNKKTNVMTHGVAAKPGGSANTLNKKKKSKKRGGKANRVQKKDK